MKPQRPGTTARSRSTLFGPPAVAAVLLSAALLNQSAIHWRTNVADSHLFEYHGWCVSRGAVPYVDVWDNKPPGIWWVNAVAFALLGPGVMPGVVVSGLTLLVALGAFVVLARTAFRASLIWPATVAAVVLLTDQRFECGGNRTETFVLAFETLAVLCYVRWLRRGHAGALAWAGLFGGCAPLFKQSGIAATAAIWLHLLYLCFVSKAARPRRAARPGLFLWLAGGFAVAPLAAAVALALQGALGEAWFAVSTFNRAYFAVDDATWTRLDRAWMHFRPAVELLTPIALLAAAGLLVGGAAGWRRSLPSPCPLPGREGGEEPSPCPLPGREGGEEPSPCPLPGREGREEPSPCPLPGREGGEESSPGPRPEGRGGSAPRSRRGIGVFVLWWALAVYLALVGPGRREYHLMPSLAPLGLLLLYGLHRLAGRRTLGRAMARSPLRAAGVVVWGYVLMLFAHGNLAEIGKSWALKPAWWALERTVPAPYEAQAAVVAALTRPDDRIYVSGWSPGTYRFAYRLPGSRFATFEKLGQVGAHARFIVDGARRDLREHPPKVFVISLADYAGVQRDTASDWRAWLGENYRHHSDVQGMKILVRRDGAPVFGQPPAAPLASPSVPRPPRTAAVLDSP